MMWQKWDLDHPEYIHLFLEAKKLAFEDRAKFYADPAFYKVPVTQLISKEYAQKRAALINPNRAAPTFLRVNQKPEYHLSDTADKRGIWFHLSSPTTGEWVPG